MKAATKVGLIVAGAITAVGATSVSTSLVCYSGKSNGQGKCIIMKPDGGYSVANGSGREDGEIRGECEVSICFDKQ